MQKQGIFGIFRVYKTNKILQGVINMKKFTLEEIAAACGGKYVGDENLKSTAISSVERDSRCIKENSLFLAIKGERVDGHD